MALRTSIIRRFKWISCIICVLFLVAIGKMALTMTVERAEWLKAGQKQERKNREIEPERGNIYACDGQLMAATIPYYKLYMDLGVEALHAKGGRLYKENIDSLCIAMSRKFGDRSPAGYRSMFDAAYLKKNRYLRIYPDKVSYIDLEEVKQFPLFRLGRNKSGLIDDVEFANRENLYGSMAARTIGNVYGSSGSGQYGLELYYDSLLSGVPGVERGVRAGRTWVYVPEKEALDGCDIVTTIDVDIQDICEVALRNKLIQIEAENGCLVMMEVKTGQIKAMVNLGRTASGTYKETKNMAVADMSEPGSTFKAMSLMIALDKGVCDTSDVLDINYGRWQFADRTMTDHNWKRGGYDSLTVSEVLAFSSNVGTSRIIDEHFKSKPEEFVDAVMATGFADDMKIEIPGASVPVIPHPKSYKYWSRVTLPWMSIGYNTQIPPIYTLNFYNAIANDGKLMRPYLVQRIEKDGRVVMEKHPHVVNSSVCKSSTLRKLQGMLEDVVKYGTAKPNRSREFAIAGKTGTAQLQYGGSKGAVRHQVSFCGYFPADEPVYSCIVVVKEPRMLPSASFMAGAVFKDVAEKVYAQKVNRKIGQLPRWTADSVHCANLPQVKAGYRKNIENALGRVDVDYEWDNNGEWVAVRISDDGRSLVEQQRTVLDNLVPNVVGMGAADALYLMERAGLHVQIYGKGRVRSQSIASGSNVVKGATVILQLR
ncbi:MAG: penicillin-binding protein [Candidatus Aphodosoma sp.]